MTASAPPAPASLRASLGSAVHYGLLAAVAAATAGLAMTGSPLMALIPVPLATVAYLATRIPLRYSAFALVGLLLIPDDTVEAAPGQWRTPFAFVGDLLHFRLDAVAGVPGLAVTGMEVVAVFLLGIWLYRKATGSRIDGPPQGRQASVVKWFLLLYVAGVLASEAFGLARGLPLAPWKLRNLLHPVLLAGLFLLALRDRRDHLVVGRIVVLAACARAVMAFVVQRLAELQTGGPFAFATSHGDSLLFSVGLFLVIVDLLERPDRSRLVRAAIIVPLLIQGGIDNQRRIFWVELVLVLVVLYLLAPMKGWKLALTRTVLVVIPVIAIYVGAGWQSGSRLFAPVKTLRGLVDPTADRSTYWREVENWNIAMSMREMPVTGLGLGGQYTEVMANDSVADSYKEYREWPHNSFLGLLLLMGLFGFTAVFALTALTTFLSIRSYRLAETPDQRVVALGCLGVVVAGLVLAWGDLGTRFAQYKVLVALAVAVTAGHAAASGAWPPARARLRRLFERRPRRGAPVAVAPAGARR